MPRVARASVKEAVVSASEIASRLHHRLGTWERDSRWSAVAFCTQCDLAAHVYFGRRAEDEERQGGSVLAVVCEGRQTRPIWRAA